MPLLRTNGGNVPYTSQCSTSLPVRNAPTPNSCRIITDRYALPKGSDLTKCNPADQSFCGGTWSTIKDNLDYIQNAGFTASAHTSVFFACTASNHIPFPPPPLVWISPISQNYEGPRTPYGDPYHGYWIADASQLNSRFGSAADLKALSDEVHRRGM